MCFGRDFFKFHFGCKVTGSTSVPAWNFFCILSLPIAWAIEVVNKISQQHLHGHCVRPCYSVFTKISFFLYNCAVFSVQCRHPWTRCWTMWKINMFVFFCHSKMRQYLEYCDQVHKKSGGSSSRLKWCPTSKPNLWWPCDLKGLCMRGKTRAVTKCSMATVDAFPSAKV